MSRVNKDKGEYRLNYVQFENHKLPEFKEVKGREFVYYGENNLYPQYLIELYNRCSTHNAVVTGKAQMIKGKGFEETANNKKFIANSGGYEDLNYILFKTAVDLELFGGFALEVTFGMVGGQIAAINHIDISKLRLTKDKDMAVYSENWAIGSRADKKTFKIWHDKAPRQGTYIYYFKQYRTGIDCYPIPEYIGSIAAIETDVEINNFHLNEIKQGFAGGTMINFNNGVPNNPEKQREIERKLKNKFAGTDNAGGVVINFSDSPDKKPDIMPLNGNDLDKRFEQLRKDTTQEIFIGHKVTSPMLFGVKTEGQLGGRTEYLDAFELFTTNYIKYKQEVLEECFEYLGSINGVEEMHIQTLDKPLGQVWSEATLTTVMTKDEIRETLGLLPLGVNTLDGQQPEAMGANVNTHIKALSGREMQNLMRIVRKYENEQLTKEQAILLIKNGFGLSDEEALTYLGVQEQAPGQFAIDLTANEIKTLQLLDKAPMLDDIQLSVLLSIPIEEVKPLVQRLIDLDMMTSVLTNGNHLRMLSDVGEKYAKLYAASFSDEITDERKVEMFMAFGEEFTNKTAYFFAADFELTILDKNILAGIKGNKRLDINAIAKTSKVEPNEVNDRIVKLTEEGLISSKEVNSYGFPEMEYSVTDKGNSILKSDVKIQQIEVRYKYAKRPGLKGDTLIPTSREFCKKMVKATDTSKETYKLFTRQDINKLSALLGYNVWEQKGGYYHNPNTDVTSPFCRHQWMPVKIIKRK